MRVESGHGAHAERMMAGARASRGRANRHPPQAPSGEAAEAASTARDPGVRERGVIRRLREGHFNPVAALRHHIKFQAEITAAGIEPLDIGTLEASGKRGASLARFIEQYRMLQDTDGGADTPPAADESPASGTETSSPETEETSPVHVTA